MEKPQTFTAPAKLADPTARGRVGITITVTPSGEGIQINYFPTVNKESRARSFYIIPEDDESFIVPADLHQSTVNMLIGIGQRYMQLMRHGFEREP